MNLQPAFWDGYTRFPGDVGSPVDAVLSRESFTLEDLLDQDDVIQECKYLNSDLVDYLSRQDVVERLVKYVVESADLAEEVEAKGDEFLMGKYSFIASELLVVENMQIVDALFASPTHLQVLFGFLQRPAPLDATVTSYFRKVVVSLIQRKFAQLMRFLRSQRSIVASLVEHIGLYSVMEVLIMIGWDDGLGQIRQYADVQWLYTEGVIPKLLSRLDPKYGSDPDVHTNAARALVDVVAKCPSDQSNLLVTHLQSGAMLKVLFGHMFSGSRSSLTNALSVAIQLVQKSSVQEEYAAEAEEREMYLQSPLAAHVTNNLDRLCALIVEPPEADAMDTQYGRLDPPLGETRIKGVEMFVVLYGSHYRQIHEELVRRRVLDRILDLFFRFKWNNMLHSLVESVVLAIVECDTDEIKVSAFRDSRLAERLVDAYEENEVNEKKPRCFRYGYMGHVIRICNGLAAIDDDLINEYLGDNERWTRFVTEKLSVDNERQSTIIGGRRPHGHEDEDEDDYDDVHAAQVGALHGVGHDDDDEDDDDDDDDDEDDEDEDDEDAAGKGKGENGNRSLAEMIHGFISDEFEEEADNWGHSRDADAWGDGAAPAGDYPGSSSSDSSDSDSDSTSSGTSSSDDEEAAAAAAAGHRKKGKRGKKARKAEAGSSDDDSDGDEFVVQEAAAGAAVNAGNLAAVARMYAESDGDDDDDDEKKADEAEAGGARAQDAAFNDIHFWRSSYGDHLELDEDI